MSAAKNSRMGPAWHEGSSSGAEYARSVGHREVSPEELEAAAVYEVAERKLKDKELGIKARIWPRYKMGFKAGYKNELVYKLWLGQYDRHRRNGRSYTQRGVSAPYRFEAFDPQPGDWFYIQGAKAVIKRRYRKGDGTDYVSFVRPVQGTTAMSVRNLYMVARWPEAGEIGNPESVRPSDYGREDWFTSPEKSELSELWHISRVALSGKDSSRYQRLLYVSREWEKTHPGQGTRAYKYMDLVTANLPMRRNPEGAALDLLGPARRNPDSREAEDLIERMSHSGRLEELPNELGQLAHSLAIAEQSAGTNSPLAEAIRKRMSLYEEAIRLAKKRYGKHNPEGAALNLYEQFHGKPATHIDEYTESQHVHEFLAEAGDLTCLKIATMTQLDAEIDFTGCGVKVAFSEDGRQMYFVSGDQSLDLDGLKMGSDEWLKDSMCIGVLYEVTYQTEKKFDKFKLTDYFHGLGEETGNQPVLNYSPLDRRMSVSGGTYRIELGLLNLVEGVSPGIVD